MAENFFKAVAVRSVEVCVVKSAAAWCDWLLPGGRGLAQRVPVVWAPHEAAAFVPMLLSHCSLRRTTLMKSSR